MSPAAPRSSRRRLITTTIIPTVLIAALTTSAIFMVTRPLSTAPPPGPGADADIVIPVNPTPNIYSANPTGSFRRSEIDRAEADIEIRNDVDGVGFDRVYFHRDVINDLLQPSDVVGILVQNVIPDPARPREGTLVAIGVDANRNIKYNGTTLKYRRSDGVNSAGQPQLTLISQTQMETQRQNSINAGLITYYAFFSRTALQQTISVGGATGIHFMTGLKRFAAAGNSYRETYTAAPSFISSSFNTEDVIPSSPGIKFYLKSPQPCPPDCGQPPMLYPQ